MGCSPEAPDRLTPLQRKVLRRFFELERGFFLTGGGALVGFHLRHREATDLDLFTRDDGAWARGGSVAAQLANDLNASLQIRQESPAFRRYVLEVGGEGLVLDLVREWVPAAYESPIELPAGPDRIPACHEGDKRPHPSCPIKPGRSVPGLEGGGVPGGA